MHLKQAGYQFPSFLECYAVLIGKVTDVLKVSSSHGKSATITIRRRNILEDLKLQKFHCDSLKPRKEGNVFWYAVRQAPDWTRAASLQLEVQAFETFDRTERGASFSDIQNYMH
jgi:hypothetical protein